MIRLINGRGQLGNALSELISEKDFPENLVIYHTWNFLDKSKETQRECYETFKRFVDENGGEKIIFISTYSESRNHYTYFKHMSEEYLSKNNSNGYIIRLPNLVGKGICENLRGDAKPFGEIELMTIEEAAKEVLDFAQPDQSTRNLRVEGTIIPTKLVKKLILFGSNGK